MKVAAARRPGRLYGIADVGRLGPERLVDAVLTMVDAGLTTVQVRAKTLPDVDLEHRCRRLRELVSAPEVGLWIDDRADAARMLGFDGVHLGQADLPPAKAREMLAATTAIGFSTHTLEQVRAADADPAVDWIAIGPVFPTTSKRNPDAVVGIGGVEAARRVTSKPLIAIGGIKPENAALVLAAGADSVALLSALCDGDVSANCRGVLDLVAAAVR